MSIYKYIPFGGIVLFLCSGGFFFWSSKAKKRAILMENSKEYTAETALKNAQPGEYCSISGSLQPMKENLLETNAFKVRTVLYFTQYIHNVKYTTREKRVANRRTRNPTTEYVVSNYTKEEPTPLEPHYVPFGLFDMLTKSRIEIQFSDSKIFEPFTIPKRKLVTDTGINFNFNLPFISIGGTNDIGVIGRNIESTYQVEKYLPVEILSEDQKPRSVVTIFGKITNTEPKMITDIDCKFKEPFFFAFKSRNEIINEEKKIAVYISYFALFTLVLAAGVSVYELNGIPGFLKEDTSW